MKNLLLILLFLGILSTDIVAQQQKPVESIRFAVEANTGPSGYPKKSAAIKYSLIKSSQIKLSRWDYEVSLGYINHYASERALSQYDYYFKGTHSQRIVGDLNFLYNIVRAKKNALRVGLGSAIWYQRNGRITDLSVVVNNQQIEDVTFNRVYSNEVNVGINLKADYEYAITSTLIAGVRAGVTGNFLKPSMHSSLPSSLAGVGISLGYRF